MRSIVFALLLGGCLGSASSDPAMSRIDQLNTFCNGYVSSLNVLSSMRDAGELSAGQIEEIDRAELITTAACTAESMTEDRLTIVLGAINTLAVIMENRK